MRMFSVWGDIASVIIFCIIVTILFVIIPSIPVYFLWNWIIPAVFGLGKITFLQSFGIILLAKLLFGFMSNFSIKEKN